MLLIFDEASSNQLAVVFEKLRNAGIKTRGNSTFGQRDGVLIDMTDIPLALEILKQSGISAQARVVESDLQSRVTHS